MRTPHTAPTDPNVRGDRGWFQTPAPRRWVALAALLILAGVCHAATLKVAIDNPASVVVNDGGTLLRSDTGDFFEVPLAPGVEDRLGVSLHVIPNDAAFNFPLTLRFRVEGLATPTTGPSPGDIWWYYGGLSTYPTIVDSDLGEGGQGWYEFTRTLDAVTTPFYNHETRLVFWYNTGFDYLTEAYVYLYIQAPHDISVAEREGGPLDRWFQLRQRVWPAEYISGSSWPEEFRTDSVPVVGQAVEIGGDDLRYDPPSATTDSEGVFGVVAFVDPSTFYPTRNKYGLVIEPAKASAMGTLRMKYKKLIKEQGITNNFCEVIMVEGTVRVMGGEGTVKAGDILFPGQTLSLGASWGQKAQIGLRFVNGSDATVIQDVFTNACLTDMIVIGSSGIEDSSVLQGNTPLMSVARTLCEKVAGLPSTPEQWATAAGRFVVTTAASNAVPGSGIVAFVVRYGVSTAAGKAYDHVVNSRSAQKKTFSLAGEPTRMDLSLYYDGSSRLAHNMSGPMQVMEAGQATTFTSVVAGVWQELIDDAALGRNWPESLATLDVDGPDLRYAAEYFSTANPTWSRLEIRAFDPSGLDAASLHVMVDGVDRTSSFQPYNATTWRAEFWGGAASAAAIEAQLADTAGNVSTLTWSPATRPEPPTVASLGQSFTSGTLLIDWSPPAGMTEADVLYYEIQILDCYTCDNVWRSVGADSQATIPMPAPAPGSTTFRIAIRACDRSGRVGTATVSAPLSLTPGPSGWILR